MPDLARAFLSQSRSYLKGDYLPRVEKAVAILSEEDFWWRPNDASNSVGNLVLHLAGNVRQWIVHGIGGAVDVRNRDAEFEAKGGVSREEALSRLRASVDAACEVLESMDAHDLEDSYRPQAHHLTGMEVIYHVVEHFSMHTGQIIWVAKARSGEGLAFYNEKPGGLANLSWTPTPDGPSV